MYMNQKDLKEVFVGVHCNLQNTHHIMSRNFVRENEVAQRRQHLEHDAAPVIDLEHVVAQGIEIGKAQDVGSWIGRMGATVRDQHRGSFAAPILAHQHHCLHSKLTITCCGLDLNTTVVC